MKSVLNIEFFHENHKSRRLINISRSNPYGNSAAGIDIDVTEV